MSAYFTLTLDTKAPASPALLLNSGAATTGAREVAVALTTADYQGGARDVAQMKIWGDVDPAADPLVQPAEADSAWQTYVPDYVVRLSDGSARKTVSARLKDDVCNESVAFSDFIDLDVDSPVVTITTAVDRGRISKVAPCDAALFGWQSTVDFVAYQVRVVPNAGSPHIAGVLLGTTYGSLGTAGSGQTFPANTPMLTTIHGADLEAASPGDTTKTIKVFVQAADGTWSA